MLIVDPGTGGVLSCALETETLRNLRRAEINKSLTEYNIKEVPNIDLRREDTKKSRNGILIGQCAQFLIHPGPN